LSAFGEEPRQAADQAQQQEGPRSGKPCVRTGGMPRPLPLDPDGETDQRGYRETRSDQQLGIDLPPRL
jgi:hypothetical protein